MPYATARTAAFDDYTPGSYHINKLDLSQGLWDEAKHREIRLRALVVVGPSGVLWTYHVLAFTQDGPTIRVNHVVMPHARITAKRTGHIPEDALDEMIGALTAHPLVRAGPPGPSANSDKSGSDFRYNLLLVRYEEASPRYWHATHREIVAIGSVEERENKALFAPINRVLESTHATYRTTHGHD